MSVNRGFFRAVLAVLLAFVFVVTGPSMGALAKDSGNYMKKNNLRTNLREHKSVNVQSYCYGLGLRDSKVKVIAVQKEDSSGVEGYEVALIKIRISTPKLNAKNVKKAIKAANKAGMGNNISASYFGVIMDGNTGMNLSVLSSGEDQIDGVYSYVTMEYDGLYEQKAAGYEIEGYKDLIYTFAVAYPKARKNLYIGIAGVKKPDKYTRTEFEEGTRKFTRTNMYSKKNNKLSAFYKVN
ncbi:MAG: hypothetical protein K6E70_07900 [Butyrivibrio sp.]|nr:hypothetical protein [Butyrivibrio sp.]